MQLLDHCFRPGQSRRTVAYSGCIHCIIQNPRRRRLSQPTSSIAFTLIKIPPPLPHYQSRSSARSAHWFLFDPANGYVSSALTKAAADAEVRGWKVSEEKNDWYKKALTEKGMKIMTPSPKLMGDLKQVGAIMLSDWQKRAGPDGEAMVAAYLKSAPKAAPAKK